MSFYSKLQKTSSKIIKNFKQGTIKLVQFTQGTGPIDNPGSPIETLTILDAVASRPNDEFIKNGFSVSTDMIVTAAVIAGVTPTMNDYIEIDGVRHKIVADISAPASGTKVVWKFIVRSGV